MSDLLIVGNWKMNGSSEANQVLLDKLALLEIPNHIHVGICAPFVYLAQLSVCLRDSRIAIGAQDMSIHLKGAYTGEISGAMLKEFHCRYVIVGHSERRQYHQESNQLVAQKAKAALDVGLTPIICVGESLAQRESGETLDIIDEQCVAIKEALNTDELSTCVVAYEPVWAIGTGLTATPVQAQEVHHFIRQNLGQDKQFKILYGGSVNSSNAAALFSQADINGGLVGGASLDVDTFASIIG